MRPFLRRRAAALDTTAQRAALVHRITSANPDGTPGGTYQLGLHRAGNLLASVPAAVAARTPAAGTLRTE